MENNSETKELIEVTINDILSVFKNYTEEKSLKDIKNAVVALKTPASELINPNEDEIKALVEKIVKEDKKRDSNSYLTYNNHKGKYRKRKRVPPPNSLQTTLSTNYIGRAGEMAVISELIYRGYNANRMMIDEGVDIIAVKDNIYYYVQVKTTLVKENGNITCSIDKDRYDQYISKQIRYIIVARYKDNKNIDRNMFFMFTPDKLQEAIYQHCIKRGEKIYIKIKFNERTGEPFLYDEKEMNIAFCMYNFNL